MNILFLSLVKFSTLEERGIYQDLLRKFRDNGHQVFIVVPTERKYRKSTYSIKEPNTTILNVWTFNIQKTHLLEKGLGTLAIEYQYLAAIKKHFGHIQFDLVLYSTPPITFYQVVKYIKEKDKAYAYLLLKDIFPQNAVDMKMMKEGGIFHRFFLRKERKLYDLSDTIGCMSEANKDYLLTHNSTIGPSKVEVNPNSVEPIIVQRSTESQMAIRNKYGLPLNKKILIYGGNLGKPQGLDFLLETIIATHYLPVFFLIVGSGTEYPRIQHWFQKRKPPNASLMAHLDKTDYDQLLTACDVGLIFLHKDFTIPNFPSRLLSYLENRLPVIAATDACTDLGKVIEQHNCGYWVLSGDIEAMKTAISNVCTSDSSYMRQNAWDLLQANYTVDISFRLINDKIECTKTY